MCRYIYIYDIHMNHHNNALNDAQTKPAFFWLTLPIQATMFDDSHLFGIYSFISHFGSIAKGKEKHKTHMAIFDNESMRNSEKA